MAKVVTSGFDLFDKALVGMARKVDSSAAATLKAAAAVVVAEARAKAPVYSGPRHDVPKGRLRKAIKAGRVRRTSIGLWEVKVSVQSFPAWAYAGQEEERSPYMEPARAVGLAALPALASAALEKVAEL
jgi:hypothetical protein